MANREPQIGDVLRCPCGCGARSLVVGEVYYEAGRRRWPAISVEDGSFGANIGAWGWDAGRYDDYIIGPDDELWKDYVAWQLTQ